MIVLLTISHDGVVSNVSVKWWKDLNAVTHVDWVLIAQNVLRYNVVFVGKVFQRQPSLGGMEKRPPGRV